MLKSCNIDDIPNDNFRYGKNVKEIQDFLKSDDLAAEVIMKPGENVKNRYAGFFLANKRMGNPILVTTKRDRLFLIKKEKE